LFVCFFFSGIYLIVGISIKKLKIWFWDLFALVVSVLFGFATSLPELGGVVGYELNLFLQDYLGNRNFITNIWIDYLCYFLKLKYHLIGLNSFSKIKELKSDLVDTGSDLKSEAYNLEEFAVNDGMRSANDDFSYKIVPQNLK
jgi:S-DNA-T family DNA segregation ATPase FtsK/SpoIIIE